LKPFASFAVRPGSGKVKRLHPAGEPSEDRDRQGR
jgi:hypothetical protein